MSGRLINSLREERLERRLSQQALADLGGISRQSYAAIESGTSVPSTGVALRLARALGLPVETLFRLPARRPRAVVADPVTPQVGRRPGRVRVVRVGRRLMAVPLGEQLGRFGEPADGMARPLTGGRVHIDLFDEAPPESALLVLGCDPAFALVSHELRRRTGLEATWLACGARRALGALARGDAHIAGVHGAPALAKAELPFPVTVVRFSIWEQCLIVARGNPLGVGGIRDLARPELRFLNREKGSGSRALVEARLRTEGIAGDRVRGFGERAASGHLAVAEAIAAGLADAGVGIRAAALAWGLDTLPLEEESYDLVIPDHFLGLPAVGALLGLLRSPAVRRQVEALGGYDAEGMGRRR